LPAATHCQRVVHHGEQHQGDDAADHERRGLQVGVRQVAHGRQEGGHVAGLQRLHDLLLVMDGQPVGRAERLVDVQRPAGSAAACSSVSSE